MLPNLLDLLNLPHNFVGGFVVGYLAANLVAVLGLAIWVLAHR